MWIWTKVLELDRAHDVKRLGQAHPPVRTGCRRPDFSVLLSNRFEIGLQSRLPALIHLNFFLPAGQSDSTRKGSSSSIACPIYSALGVLSSRRSRSYAPLSWLCQERKCQISHSVQSLTPRGLISQIHTVSHHPSKNRKGKRSRDLGLSPSITLENIPPIMSSTFQSMPLELKRACLEQAITMFGTRHAVRLRLVCSISRTTILL